MVENSLGKGERRYSKGLHYEDSFTVYMPRSKETLVYDVTIDVKLRPEKK